MSFERLYSSIFPAHFEKNSSKLLDAVLAIIVVHKLLEGKEEIEHFQIFCAYFYCMMELSDNFQLFYDLKIALPNELVPQNRERFAVCFLFRKKCY